MSLSRAPARDTSETPPSQRERIRSHMKMVIDQLEGILKELKDVAKELREVVGQIDQLTSDFDFDLEPDDWTVATASSTSSSERGLGDAFRLDFLNPDVLSDSWEFCSFLESSLSPSAAPPQKPPERAEEEEEEEEESRPARARATATATSPGTTPATATAYSQMNGGLPIPNGPLIVTPDSSSEEATSSTHSHKTSRNSGTRERVRFSDKILYHALCCDDDEDEEEEGEEEGGCGTPETDNELSPPVASPTATPPATPKLPPSEHSHHNCLDPSPLPSSLRAGGGQTALGNPTPAKKGLLNPGCRKKLVRNSSTQTVSDKSTQTVLPYIPAKQKTKDLH
ncbi:inhibitory synaptic factor 1-like [Anguilla anguilla]|uniref:inhibitory synaptic factor 1-like n=1 Tax=Anguilla anguilla TaxID=7936 RepID=UPI0015B2E7E3|nr:inhibitory synaptic factor 1-like [Anguilla anguilla]